MDVTIKTPRDKNPALSPLMQAKGRLKVGEVLNACPFGCQEDELDERGLCRHLVGYTNHSEEECKAGLGRMERLAVVGDTRRVLVRREKREAVSLEGKRVKVDGPPILEPVLKTDTLVKITTSSRVYRDEQPEKPQGA